MAASFPGVAVQPFFAGARQARWAPSSCALASQVLCLPAQPNLFSGASFARWPGGVNQQSNFNLNLVSVWARFVRHANAHEGAHGVHADAHFSLSLCPNESVFWCFVCTHEGPVTVTQQGRPRPISISTLCPCGLASFGMRMPAMAPKASRRPLFDEVRRPRRVRLPRQMPSLPHHTRSGARRSCRATPPNP